MAEQPDDDNIEAEWAAWLIAYDSALLAGLNPLGSAELLPLPPGERQEFAKDVACLELLHRVLGAERAATLSGNPALDSTPGATNGGQVSMIPERIGRFKVFRELGRGGYGIVLLAIDPHLDRQVAIKIPRPEVLVSNTLRERFVREAETAGQLDHPNLVPVYEVGEYGPYWFIASGYMSGGTLTEWVAARREPLPIRAAAAVVAHLADAVQHAHSAGILHRDIKPSNVMMQPVTETQASESVSSHAVLGYVPRLGDFGLAKLLGDSNDETLSGALLGTPSYMAPEQAAGRPADLGTATDVYGLGAILYELLSGQPPFRGGSSIDTLRKVLDEEAVPPRRLRPEVNRDLEAICLKCLNKAPKQRYLTARELGQDLRRYLAGEPAEARPVRTPEKFIKWCRRKPASAALVAIALGATATLFTSLIWSNWQISKLLKESQTNFERAEQLLYTSDLQLAQQAALSHDFGQAKAILRRHLPAAGRIDRREFAWRFLWNSLHREAWRLAPHAGDVYELVYSPDGKRLVSACRDGKTRIWDTSSGKLLKTLGDHLGEVNVAAFSPDGACLATAGDDGIVLIRSTSDYRIVRKLPQETNPGSVLRCIAFSPDSKLLYVGVHELVRIWEVASGRRLQQFKAHERGIDTLSISPDGKILLTNDGTIRLWDRATLALRGEMDARSSQSFTAASFLMDGVYLAAGDDLGRTTIYTVNTLAQVVHLEAKTNAKILTIASSPDGRFVAAGSADRLIEVFQTGSWQPWATFGGHDERVWAIRFSPRDNEMVSADGAGKVCFWRIPEAKTLHLADGILAGDAIPRSLTAQAYSPDGKWQAWGAEGAILVRPCDGGAQVRLPQSTGVISQLVFDGEKSLVSFHDPARICVWDLATARLGKTLEFEGGIICAALSPRGDRLAALRRIDQSDTVDVLEWPSGKTLHRFEWPARRVESVAFNLDGSRLTIGRDGELGVFAMSDYRQVLAVKTQPGQTVQDVDFLRGGDAFIAAERGGGATIRESATGRLLYRLTGHPGAVVAVAAHPNGRNVVSLCDFGVLRIWDLSSRQTLLQFSDKLQPKYSGLDFSPTGKQLMLASNHDRDPIAIWDAHEGPLSTPTAPPLPAANPSTAWPRRYGGERSATYGVPAKASAAAWHPHQDVVLLGNSAGELYTVDPERDKVPQPLPARPESEIMMVGYRPSGDRYLTLERSGAATWWNEAHQVEKTFEIPANLEQPLLSPSSETLLWRLGASLQVVDSQTGELLWERPLLEANMNAAWASSELVALAENDGSVRFLRRGDGSTLAEHQLGSASARYWTPANGERIAASRIGGGIVVYEVQTGRQLEQLDAVSSELYWRDPRRLFLWRGIWIDEIDIQTKQIVATSPALSGQVGLFNARANRFAVIGSDRLDIVWFEDVDNDSAEAAPRTAASVGAPANDQ